MAVSPALSWEEYLARFIELSQAEEATVWAQAEVAYEMTKVFGRKAATKLAADIGRTATHIRSLVSTYKAFPTPESRAQDLSFTHHKTAAVTEDPQEWLNQAVANQWSVKDMKETIKDAKDKLAEADQYRRAQERMEREIERFNKRWGHKGLEASLEWVKIDVPSKKTA